MTDAHWRGDAAAGVDAWLGVASGSQPPDWLADIVAERTAEKDKAGRGTAGTAPDGSGESDGVGRGRSRRSGGRRSGQSGSRGSRSGRSGRSGQRRPVPEDTVAQGPDADPESVARTILLDQLTGRARSRKELADKLAGKDVPDQIAGPLLDRFEEVGLIDDAAFARSWVSARQQNKGLARRALGQELRRKGVDDEVVKEALDEVDPADEEQAARRLVRKKLRSVARCDDVTATRRLAGMLARKGYPAGLTFSVVRSELEAARDEAALDEAGEGPDGPGAFDDAQWPGE